MGYNSGPAYVVVMEKGREVIGRYAPDLPGCVTGADCRYADADDRD